MIKNLLITAGIGLLCGFIGALGYSYLFGPSSGKSSSDQTQSPTLEQGIRLLEQGQFESARSLFERLLRSRPHDARVWYFGALAVGLASGDWDDEARDLVEKGIELERAGTPPSAQIDAAFAAAAPIPGEPWLNSLRRRSLTASRTP